MLPCILNPIEGLNTIFPLTKTNPMSTTLIILGVLGAVVFFYLLSQIANPSNSGRQLQNHAPPPYGYTLNPNLYQPMATIPEEQPTTGFSLWPIFALMAIAAIFYLIYNSPPVEKEAAPIQKNVENVRPKGSLDTYDYPDEATKGQRYYNSGEQKQEYPVPPSTPQAKKEQPANPPVESYDGYAESKVPAPKKNDKAPDYRQGYGVQLFATEKGWWEEAHVRQIQESYPNFLLLIGTSRASGNMNKFILGSFANKAAAGLVARQAGKDFPGAYVVDLSELEQVDRYWTVP